MADKLNINGKLEWVRADRLTVDPAYQRDENETKIRKIVRDFDPDAFGVLYLARRGDGSIVILDGQQRRAALLRMGWGDQQVPAVVYSGLEVEEEAALFVQYNELRTKPRPMDLHRARVAAGDKRALFLTRTATVRGLTISEGNVAGRIQAIGALNSLYDSGGPKVVERTVDIVLHAYGAQPDTFQGDLLIAVGVIVARHGRYLDDARISKVLTKATPTQWLRASRLVKAELDQTGGNLSRVATVVAGRIMHSYNQRIAVERRIPFDLELTGPAYWQPVTKGA